MLTPFADLPVSAADSARAAASVYTASLLATAPIVAAALAAFSLRRATAEGRVLVWRAAVVMLLVAFIGRALPVRLAGWSVPSIVATPLIALGRIQVADLAHHAADDYVAAGARWIQLAFAVYLTGVFVALLPTVLALARAHRLLRRAHAPRHDPSWAADLAEAGSHVGVSAGRDVRLLLSREVAVPMTWGHRRPVILLPSTAMGWTADQRRIVLRHELAHVRAADWAFGVVARLACAVYWFHPGAWWIARSLRDDAERAADDRVIASGVARSDYAELLIAASVFGAPLVETAHAFSNARRGPLRARLAAILDVRRDVRPLARRWALVATAACAVTSVPLGAAELAPTRDVLARLMRDSRWESRAYAVIGLAHRADTVAFARSAAELDPSPRVRAWARQALGLRPETAPVAAAATKIR